MKINCENLQKEHSILEHGLISCKKFGNVTEENCKECKHNAIIKSNCDHCLKLNEANKLKIPTILIPVDLEKDEVRWCRKCYLDLLVKFKELKKAYDYRLHLDICYAMKREPMNYIDWELQSEQNKESKKLFDDCKSKGKFVSCRPQFCSECQRRGDVVKPINCK